MQLQVTNTQFNDFKKDFKFYMQAKCSKNSTYNTALKKKTLQSQLPKNKYRDLKEQRIVHTQITL